MPYAKVIDDTVVQIQPNAEDGFEQVGQGVCYGMVRDGSGFIVPPKTPEQVKEERIEEIKQELDAIDRKSVRALRAYGRGKESPEDSAWLEALGVDADTLRIELDNLIKGS